MEIFWIPLCAIMNIVMMNAQEFHQKLKEDDLLHYFGTREIKKLPEYTILDETDITGSYVRKKGQTRHFDIHVFGTRYNIPLHHNNKLVGAACYVHHMMDEGSIESGACDEKYRDCQYSVQTDEYKAAFSACNGTGVFGFLSSQDYNLIIQPILKSHITMLVDIKHSVNIDRIPTNNSRPHLVIRKAKSRETSESGRVDGASHNNENTIERQLTVMVACGASTTNYFISHGTMEDLILYIITVLNIVATLFQDETLSNKLVVSIGPLFIFNGPTRFFQVTPDAQETLDGFCSWQEDFGMNVVDASVLISRMDFAVDKTLQNSDLTGLAFKPGICKADIRCALAEDNGLETAFTIAHEIGHTLNMSHDDLYPGCNNTGHIMQAHGSQGSASFKWSKCSDEAMTNFLYSSRSTDCLESILTPQIQYKETPGEIYNKDMQCFLAFGRNYVLTDNVAKDKCTLACCLSNTCKTIKSMDGTECGFRKWCKKGLCNIIDPFGPVPQDGGWSEWGKWSQCSRTANGGIHHRHRRCNNPIPRYNGAPCNGSDKVIRLCNIKPFAASDWLFKKQQLSSASFKLNKIQQYSCFMASDNETVNNGKPFIDGTNCQDVYGNVDRISKCYKGQCESFGCDGYLNSSARFDHCGDCNGDGDCLKFQQSVFFRDLQRTNTILLPSGITSLKVINKYHPDVKLMPISKRDDFCDRYDFSHVTELSTEIIRFLGPLRRPLRIKISKSANVNSFRLSDKLIEYEFWIPKAPTRPRHVWRYHNQLECSVTCGNGVRMIRPVCVDRNNHVTDDKLCSIREMPREITENCILQDCPESWQVGEYSSCSKSCGKGESRRYIRCYQNIDGIISLLPRSACSHLPKPVVTKVCNPHNCPPQWEPNQWSACSTPCGIGMRTRTVNCIDWTSKQPVNDSVCLDDHKPPRREICCVRPCYVADEKNGCFDHESCTRMRESDCAKQEHWRTGICPRKCGLCGCRDVYSSCTVYKQFYCIFFRRWSQEFCAKSCGWCSSSENNTCERIGANY